MQDFWKVDLGFATKVAGFTEAVRAFILETISKSHSIVSTAVLKTALNVTDADVQTIVAGEKWTLENSLITITPNDDNQMRPKKIQETIEFDDVLKVVHTLSR